MKILVTGGNGLLGSDLVPLLIERGHEVYSPGKEELDITDENSLASYSDSKRPDAIINSAAYTNVDKAEDEKSLCFNINCKGVENLRKISDSFSIPILQMSSDYVFNGKGKEAFKINSPLCPLNTYGESKARAEEEIKRSKKYFIVRTEWLFGGNGKNFIQTILTKAKEEEIKVISDQIGSPTYTKDLSVFLSSLIESEKYGIYHATNEGFCSWYTLSSFVFEKMGIDRAKLKAVKSSEYKTKAIRPLNSRLDKTSLDENAFSRLPTWQDAVTRYIGEMYD